MGDARGTETGGQAEQVQHRADLLVSTTRRLAEASSKGEVYSAQGSQTSLKAPGAASCALTRLHRDARRNKA